MRSKILCLILLKCVVLSWCESCGFPPSLWCSSEDIAKQCQVYFQCEANVWTTSKLYTLETVRPVELGVYYESMCPDSVRFFQEQLWPTWQKLHTIVNLILVPFGNAFEHKEGDKWVFQCQHGPDECTGNIIQTCALELLGNINVSFPFIQCMMTSGLLPQDSAPKCAKRLGIPYQPIENCARGPEGNHLEHEMAVVTNALQPPHTYVPWVTINRVHTEEMEKQAENDLLRLICDTYKGRKPMACESSVPLADRKCLRP